MAAEVEILKVDMDYVEDVMMRLLATPSPSGRTDAVMQMIGEELRDAGIDFGLTRRGVLLATLPGERSGAHRAVAVHADTIGCMVKSLKDNGRLEVISVGTFSARFAEGAHTTIFVDDLDTSYSGTVLPLKASGHTFGDEIDTQGVGWPLVEVRVDAPVHTAQDLADLGIQVGDFVAIHANPQITPNGYVKSRHLDDKAGVALLLGAFRAVARSGVRIPVSAHLLVTIGEEVGMGATHGLDADVAEFVAVDNAVVAPGQYSEERTVNVAMADSTGPFDYHLSRRLIRLCHDLDIPVRRDVFRFYRSDAAPAIESGLESRTALVGFGIDSSHGHERTHLDGLRHIAEFFTAYLQTELTFSEWDAHKQGQLADFPSRTVQPARQAVSLSEEPLD